MIPKVKDIKGFSISYFSDEEIKILEKEIFSNCIYDVDLHNDKPFIIDVGCYIGLSIAYFKVNYPSCFVIGFEPNPNVFPLLEENIDCNCISNVELHNVAVGKRDCVRDLYIDSSGIGAFSTSSFIKNAWNGTQMTVPIQVKVERLSKYITRDIDLLKLDIEGGELDVLEELVGASKMHFIKHVVMEYHPVHKGGLDKVKSILYGNGMSVEVRDGLEGKDDELVTVVGCCD